MDLPSGMTPEQAGLFAIFGAVFAFMLGGWARYDLVAFAALVVGTLAGLVPVGDAFSGFGHPAVVIIALVLIVSRGLTNSGAVELIASRLLADERGVPAHIAVMSAVGAALSAVINNVAALALLMPLDIEAAEKAARSVGRTLMPLSFATILGGMITMIGTPPNIVVAQYREDALGTPFAMFDFAPVGLAVAVAGVVFVALIGWRLLPTRTDQTGASKSAGETLYVAELTVGEGSKTDGLLVWDLLPAADAEDVTLIGVERGGRRLPGFARYEPVREGDVLLVEGDPKAIEAFMGKAGLAFTGSVRHEEGVKGGNLVLREAIVPEAARVVGRTAAGVRLLSRYGIALVGVSRSGRRLRTGVRTLQTRPGDVLLLLGPADRMEAAADALGVLVIEGRSTGMLQRERAWLAMGLFALAVLLAATGLVYLPIGLGAVVAIYASMGLVGGHEVYETVEWKVIVLLACLIPLGLAFEREGAAGLIAGGIVGATAGWPAWGVLLVLMVVTMTLSDFLNNVATALLACPIAVSVAASLSVSPDPFLMGVAVAASCAFLTPIGHKNNTIVMGPGRYAFGDYWRMGLPLELIVLTVAVPLILLVWPL